MESLDINLADIIITVMSVAVGSVVFTVNCVKGIIYHFQYKHLKK